MSDPYDMRGSRPIHFAGIFDATRHKAGKTPCGVAIKSKTIPIYVDGNFTEQTIYKPRIRTDMASVTCKRCIASWSRAVRERS